MKMDTSTLKEEKEKKINKKKKKQVRNVVKICSKKKKKKKTRKKNEDDLFHTTQHTHQSTKNTNERIRSITQHVGDTLINL